MTRTHAALEQAEAIARSAAQATQDGACCVCPAPEPPLRPEAAAHFAGVLKALADPHRLRIVSLLAAQPVAAPLCVCDIEASFDLSQPTISHHLRVLREAGLVAVTKRGLWHYYALAPSGLDSIRRLLEGLQSAGASPRSPAPRS